MKRIAIITACTLLVCACGSKTKKNVMADDVTAQTMKVDIKDSLRKVEGLGEVKKVVYEGPIPAADTPGQEFVLKLYKQADAKNGVFALSQTFKEAEDGKDMSFHSYGNWSILEGTAQFPEHQVYKLESYGESGNTMYFLHEDRQLHILDMDMKRIESEHNYTLRRR